MFLGEYKHTIDDKGRVIIPSRFRESLGARCIVSKGLDGCLFVFPEEEWNKLVLQLEKLPLTKKDARAFTRLFLAGAAEVEKDKQGRIALPAPLKEYAKLEKDVMVTGVANRIEIWNLEQWQQYSEAAEDGFEQLAELMESFEFDL